jgi:single-stranded-DNA-specific exonuclease
MAVGAQVGRPNLDALRERLCAVASRQLDAAALCPCVDIDAAVQLAEVTPELVAELERMEPFGQGNREPLFAASGVRVVDRTLVGKDAQHLKLWVTDEQYTYECIGFGMARDERKVEHADRLDICFAPQMNDFQGYRTLQLRLHALRPSGACRVEGPHASPAVAGRVSGPRPPHAPSDGHPSPPGRGEGGEG